MASRKQRVDAAKKRSKRSKIFALVGCVLLVAIGAYEIPSMLAVMNKKPPPSTYDPGPNTGSGLPNVAVGAAATPATAAPTGELVDTDAPPPSGEGQLVSFSVFQTKNPFTPQVTVTPDASATTQPTTANKPGADVSPSTSTPAATGASAASAPSGSVMSPVQTPAGSTAPASTATTTTTTTTTPAPATVSLSVNGLVSHVASQGTFPAASPVFRLVSWSKGIAEIGIVGGSYQTGDATLTLHVGTPVTLQNQTDGKRYRIELLSTR